MTSRKADFEADHNGRGAFIAAGAALIIGLIFIGFTRDLRPEILPAFLEPHRSRLVAIEIAVFGIMFVELVVRGLMLRYERSSARQVGVMARAVIRAIGYMALAVAILSILASNATLAVSIGGMMGLVIAFSTQSVIANIFAGMFLAIGRPFRLDDEIIVSGNKGRVTEMTVFHTVLRTQEQYILIPNATMLTQIILRIRERSPEPQE